ncbi:MAG: DNA polymerase/3'-5' exonuclease PolX [Anaerolineae bacterium]|nr:DNA polymerase/3'-5' exonuclease PolX [Anaerolineae bacterium]
MPVLNAEVADIFRKVADLLEIEGANPFRVRAYRNAARTVEELPRSVNEMVADDADLTELSGIGDDLAAKIKEIVRTGGLQQLEEIEARTPAELAEMLDVAGLGPKRVQQIHEELDVNTLEELEAHAEAGDIEALHGLGEKTQAKILEELQREDENAGRTRLDRADEVAQPLVAYLHDLDSVDRVEVAGSYRRRKETVGDLDILVTSSEGAAVITAFTQYEDVDEIISQGETKSTVLLRSGMQVDLRVVPKESYGAALFYFTGSKAHNVAIRNLAVDQGRKVNEYGVFEDEARIAGETETGIYELFDLPFIPPELREDRGEIETARQGELPKLVTLDDVRGDLQVHTKASDGNATLEEMAEGARDLGYAYIAITDHSPHLGVTQGLDEEALRERIEEIDALNESYQDFRVLKGIEVDILKDGSLDLSDDVLKRLDIVLGAVHSNFDLSREDQTERMIRAMDNPNFMILAHPTGRRIGKRPGYDVDVERLIEAALERGCYMEINASPERLDLNDVHARMAKQMGLKLAISTDAHRVSGLQTMRFGVDQARRGWLEAKDVLNTLTWEDLRDQFKR